MTRIEAEQIAVGAYVEFMRQALVVVELHRDAGMRLPERLAIFVGQGQCEHHGPNRGETTPCCLHAAARATTGVT